VKWYEANKAKHPEFELVFASKDNDEAGMEAYMVEDKMPWPAIKYSKLPAATGVEKLAGESIPCLVLVDATGKVLSHSFEKGTYVGPAKVLNDIDGLLGTGSGPGGGGSGRRPGSSLSTGGSKTGSFDDFFKKK
jgi:nucleoredoxin